MNTNGGFYEVETNGKLFMVYYHPKYNPIPQIQSSTSSIEVPSDEQPLLFLCPRARIRKAEPKTMVDSFSINSSPDYDLFTPKVYYDHHVLPLFWCNNIEESNDGLVCDACDNIAVGTNYYLCVKCNKIYHKECVESPIQINHPYHPEHSLQLFSRWFDLNYSCSCCGREASKMGYICTLCKIFIHPTCVMQSIPLVIEPPKKHNHFLSFFPRQASLTCNVCGLVRIDHPTYICARCNFVAHNDCMYFPHIIKISRHHHRISYISSLQFGEWSCGVCRQNIDNRYGVYTCNKCIDYVVHSKCALEKTVCDGKELKGVPEEDDIKINVRSFDVISEGVILYFLHEHQLMFQVNIRFDESKICKACVLPIYEGNFYSCFNCDFILHETCVNALPSIQHALHPHRLTLKATSSHYNYGLFRCNACGRLCNGFVYECCIEKCTFNLDVRCASITEPFDYKGHEHPLYLALNPVVKPICNICNRTCEKQLNCINKCDFIVCIECATIPYKIKYKHDKHFLTFLYGKEVGLINWCELCELCENGFEDTNMLYWCNECCTSFHVECLFKEDMYLKPGRYIEGIEIQTLGKGNMSRPICDTCKKRCYGNIFKSQYSVECSLKCLYNI